MHFIEYIQDIPLNIYFVQHMVSELIFKIFCIKCYAICAISEWMYFIVTYIVGGFYMKLLKLLSRALTFIWNTEITSVKLKMFQVSFLLSFRI